MRVAVIGAGVIGVTTAHALARGGAEVTVFERRTGVAQEASFGNAGVLAPAYATPWAAPGTPGRLLAQWGRRDAAVRLRPGLRPAAWAWIWRSARECRPDRFALNRDRMQRLAQYSHGLFGAWRSELSIACERREGYLQLLRHSREIALAESRMQWMAEVGIPHRWLEAEEVRSLEPGMSTTTLLAGAVLMPDAESANCPMFTQALRRISESLGVRYRFGRGADALIFEGDRVSGVRSAGQNHDFDAVVLCTGMAGSALWKQAGVRLPMQALHGFSATVDLQPTAFGPQRALMDEAYKTAITPLGSRMRIAGTALLGSVRRGVPDAVARTLMRVASDWYPGAARYSSARFWHGERAMLPDGPPVLGSSGRPGLFLNLGHGSTGWLMSCGSAQILADLVLGTPCAIDLDGLSLQRYR